MNAKLFTLFLFVLYGISLMSQTIKECDFSYFDAVEVSGLYDINFNLSDKCALKIIADNDAIDKLNISVTDKRLHISCNDIRNSKVQLYVSSINLKEIKCSGRIVLEIGKITLPGSLLVQSSGAFYLKGDSLSCQQVTLDCKGKTDIAVNEFNVDSFNINSSGKIYIKSNVTAVKYQLNMSGHSELDLSNNNVVFQTY